MATDPQDGYVQVAADGAGKKIDNAALIRDPTLTGYAPVAGDGDTVYRQRVVIGDDNNPRLQVKVGGEPGNVYLLVDSKGFDALGEKLDDIKDLLTLYLESVS